MRRPPSPEGIGYDINSIDCVHNLHQAPHIANTSSPSPQQERFPSPRQEHSDGIHNPSHLVALGLAIIIPFVGINVAGATSYNTQPQTNSPARSQEPTATDEQVINDLLAYIDTIPDDIVVNSTDEQLAICLKNNDGIQSTNTSQCTGAIALIVAGAVVPSAKVVNVVRLVKSLGGAKKAASAIKEAGGIKKIIATKGG